jgi:hypothetical protein
MLETVNACFFNQTGVIIYVYVVCVNPNVILKYVEINNAVMRMENV